MDLLSARGMFQGNYLDASRDNALISDAVLFGTSTGLDVLLAGNPVATNLPERRYSPGRDVVTHILCNWGANEMGLGMPTEAAFVADYQAALDYLHGVFPRATIWIMRPWRRDHDADAATLKGYIDTIVASRTAFVRLGPDEAVWLKAGDNGVLETDSGGVHYSNPLGTTLCAQAWRDVLALYP